MIKPAPPYAIDPALLTGESPYRDQLLVAMPALRESSFDKSVIYICAHGETGAMGIVVNQRLPNVAFGSLMEQLQLPKPLSQIELPVHFGGPVETEKGFVLHSADFLRADTLRINDTICITATVDILKAIALGQGPRRSVFALGYAGWGPGQLEQEIRDGIWLTAAPSDDIIFGADPIKKWDSAMRLLGIDPVALSVETGSA